MVFNLHLILTTALIPTKVLGGFTLISKAQNTHQIGYAIRKVRLQKGLTQIDLAKLSGFRQESISRIESGSSSNISTVLGLLSALKLEFKIQPKF